MTAEREGAQRFQGRMDIARRPVVTGPAPIRLLQQLEVYSGLLD
ncbi:MAG TPA: hypothetical protein VF739_12160 [Ktedonobacterales bacterium]